MSASARLSDDRATVLLTKGAWSGAFPAHLLAARLAFYRGLRGQVILSGYPHPLYDEALGGWRRIERSSFADGARSRVEVLWMNFETDRLI